MSRELNVYAHVYIPETGEQRVKCLCTCIYVLETGKKRLKFSEKRVNGCFLLILVEIQ